MKQLKQWILGALAALFLIGSAHAAGGGVPWEKWPGKTTDQAALQHGAKLFVNYCLNCHSAVFMRYNRLRDIGLTDKEIKDNLLFTSDKVGDMMKSNINPAEAKAWFGANPPDLTVIARSRAGAGGSGSDYLYTFLRSFYRDPAKPTGWNNTVFPNVGMPHALWELQGDRAPVFEAHGQPGHEVQVLTGWNQASEGTMKPEEFDKAVSDLVAYLTWMGEPAQNQRVRLGVAVLLFLALFTFIAWRLNAAFWKDVT